MDNVQLREFSFVQWRQQDGTPVVNALNEHQFSRFSNENTNIVAIFHLSNQTGDRSLGHERCSKQQLDRANKRGDTSNGVSVDRGCDPDHPNLAWAGSEFGVGGIRIWCGRDPNLVWAGSEFGVDGIQMPFRSIQLPTSDAQCSGTHQRC